MNLANCKFNNNSNTAITCEIFSTIKNMSYCEFIKNKSPNGGAIWMSNSEMVGSESLNFVLNNAI